MITMKWCRKLRVMKWYWQLPIICVISVTILFGVLIFILGSFGVIYRLAKYLPDTQNLMFIGVLIGVVSGVAVVAFQWFVKSAVIDFRRAYVLRQWVNLVLMAVVACYMIPILVIVAAYALKFLMGL